MDFLDRMRRIAMDRLIIACMLILIGPCPGLSESAIAQEVREKELQEPPSESARLVVQTGHTMSTTCLAFSPDGHRVLTAGYDGTVRHWDLKTGSLVRVFEAHEKRVTAVAFSDDGLRLFRQ